MKLKKLLLIILLAMFGSISILNFTACSRTCSNHNIAYEKIVPTCQHPGYDRYYCTKCSYEQIENHEPIKDCKQGSSFLIKIDECYDQKIVKCMWCNKELKNYKVSHHQTELLREESGNPYYKCKNCIYTKYPDCDYNLINLTIEAPEKIEYYNKIKVKYNYASNEFTLKFLNIEPKDYYLYDIIFILEEKEIYWKDYNMTFLFNSQNQWWFESYDSRGNGLPLMDIGVDTSFSLRWMSFESKDIIGIKFIFGISLK